MGIPTVAIIGAYGATGFVVARELSGAHCRLLLAGRDRRRAVRLADQLGDGARGVRADAWDARTLADLCARADVVVNCAGPCATIRDRVARVAMEHGCHYVDPGGYDILGPAMADADPELRARGLSSVSSAGWLPGLDVVFLRHVDQVARRALDSIDSLTLYSGDRNRWSATGALDIVHWVAGPGAPGCFKDGTWVSAHSVSSPRLRRLPAPAGRGLVMPVFKAELARFAAERRYPVLRAYQAMLAPSLLVTLGLVRAVGARHPERSASALRHLMNRRWLRLGPAGLVVAVAEGRRAGRRRRACGVLREPGGYWPTGLVAAVAAEEILTGELRARGSLPVSDAVDPDRFMATMAARGIRFQVTVDGATATRGERW